MTYQWPSITDFGAVSDPAAVPATVAANTAAIQTALDQVGATGGTLVFPPGHFMCGALKLPASSIVLQGSGRPPQYAYTNAPGTILDFLKAAPGTDGLSTQTGASTQMIRISDMQIQRARRRGVSGSFVHAVFENLNVSYCLGDGVLMKTDSAGQSWMYSMKNCFINHNAGAGISLSGDPLYQTTTLHLQNVYSTYNTLDGLSGNYLTTTTIAASGFDKNGRRGVAIQNSRQVTLTGTDAEINGWTGYYFNGSKVFGAGVRAASNNSTLQPGHGNFMVLDGGAEVALHNSSDTVPAYTANSINLVNGSRLYRFGVDTAGSVTNSTDSTVTTFL